MLFYTIDNKAYRVIDILNKFSMNKPVAILQRVLDDEIPSNAIVRRLPPGYDTQFVADTDRLDL